jgi:saccharopine dehydrogenase (NADP+, L-glutamate forming)
MHHILVLGAGKSATTLIESLLQDAYHQNWYVHVADVQLDVAEKKISGYDRAAAYRIEPNAPEQLNKLISMADAVISMLPPPLHAKVAVKCLAHRKHFLNASYLTPELLALDAQAKEAGLTFLVEMGLDPGIDHMSAMEMIHDIQDRGGTITSFRSHCGGLISPESDDNPWHYKISWNPRNIVMAGKDGAHYFSGGQVCHIPYHELFNPDRTVHIPGLGNYAWYPNRDSIPYINTYGLTTVSDFVRTTLRHPDFSAGWRKIVELGLTSETKSINTDTLSFDQFLLQYLGDIEALGHPLKEQFSFLLTHTHSPMHMGMMAPADILQVLLENKLALGDGDRDMIVMLHELEYQLPGSDQVLKKNASLVVKGKDPVHTAMARTVGLPLSIAVRNILNGKIHRKGVFIPVYPDVYRIVLRDLEQKGISFTVTA